MYPAKPGPRIGFHGCDIFLRAFIEGDALYNNAGFHKKSYSARSAQF
jgi:hypothetical protein